MISLRQLLDHAAEHRYGVPAFNVQPGADPAHHADRIDARQPLKRDLLDFAAY